MMTATDKNVLEMRAVEVNANIVKELHTVIYDNQGLILIRSR